MHTPRATEGAIKPTRVGRHMTYACPSGVFRGNGGYLVIMAIFHHWPDFCKAIERPELIDDPQYSTDQARLKRRDEIITMIEDWLQTFPDVESAVAHLESFHVPVAPVLSVAETLDYPHLRERGTVTTINDPIHGDLDVPGFPLKFSEFPDELPLHAPTLGQHNEEVLTSYLGRSVEEVQQLRRGRGSGRGESVILIFGEKHGKTYGRITTYSANERFTSRKSLLFRPVQYRSWVRTGAANWPNRPEREPIKKSAPMVADT